MMHIPVAESFYTHQGSGVLSGVYQYFVRLAGCSVACPLRKNCDQPDALTATDSVNVPIASIIEKVLTEKQTKWLHVTGGEPTEHEHLIAMCDAAHDAGLSVQVQTSGANPANWNHRPFVSVSPKQRAIHCEPSEILLIACNWMTAEFAVEAIGDRDCPVYVIPEATDGAFNTAAMALLLGDLRRNGINARAGLQSHLLWGVR